MTMQEILAGVASGAIKPEDASALLASVKVSTKNALHVSINKSGGVFIRHPKFVAHSAAKDKDYTAGLNIPREVAAALFGKGDESAATVKEISAAVVALLASV